MEPLKAVFAFTLLALCFLCPVSAALPYQSQLTLEGYTLDSPHILVGRFTKSERQGGYSVGHFRVGQVLKGPHKAGETLELNSRTTTWIRFSDSDDILVFYPNSTEKSLLPAAGPKDETLRRIREFMKQQKEKPFGSILAIGVHLRKQDPQEEGLAFIFEVKNFSRQAWTVNLDRAVRPTSHRSVSVVFYQSNVTSGTLRTPTEIYRSERPWIGRAVMETAREGARPDRHTSGATARLESGESTGGSIELRPAPRKDFYKVYINGHADRGGEVQLDPNARIFMTVSIHDDYHYYTGNGSRLPQKTWFGSVTSNPASVFE